MTHNVFNIFSYETLETSDDGEVKIFVNCTFLKPFGNYKVDDKVTSLSLQLKLIIWDENGKYLENGLITVK